MIWDEMIHLHGLVKVVFGGFQHPDFYTKAKCKTSHMRMSFISISTEWITLKIKVLAFALVLKKQDQGNLEIARKIAYVRVYFQPPLTAVDGREPENKPTWPELKIAQIATVKFRL